MNDGYKLNTHENPSHLIKMMRVSQRNATFVMTDICSYRDTVYAVEDNGKTVDEDVVELKDIYGNEFYYFIDEDTVINLISNSGQVVAMKGNITSLDIFNSIYDDLFKSLNFDATKEFTELK